MVGPLPVREFTTVAEMRAHYAAVHARCFAPKAPTAETPADPVAQMDAQGAETEVRGSAWAAPVVREAVIVQSHAQVTGAREWSAHDILRLVARTTAVTRDELLGTSRKSIIVKARQIAFWLIVRHVGMSLPQVGGLVGGKDHTTVLHAVRRVEAAAAELAIGLDGPPADVASALWTASWPPAGDKRGVR